jgi:glycosyltransferase involved in cell wall biosynthesis
MPTLVSVFGVEPRRIGGTEMFARELSAQLAEHGWDSVLCWLTEPTGEVRKFLELPNVSFATLTNSTEGSWHACRNLGRILKKHGASALHLHFVSFLTGYPWFARLAGVNQVFFTDHHSRPAGHVSRRAPWWKRVAARLIGLPLTKVICVSNYGHDCMTTTGLLPERRFRMVYNGIDLSRVSPDPAAAARFRRRFSIPDDRLLVGQVSWIIPEKGIADFLAMARLVSSRTDKVQFVLVGDGADRDQYMRDAAEMGLGDRITFTGMINDPLREGVFQAFDVVCQFSRWEEVFGWMIAEAMAHAKPVVATRVGGIPELITDGQSGYLVSRADTEGMSHRVMELLNSPETRARMGQAARQTVETKFNLKMNVARLLESYGLGAPAGQSLADQRKPLPIDPLLILEDKA